ncbi:DUF3099 domain-containing protein [Paractinoplanes brasiliensis]|uniref:DUF3099 family protein n=1 Tax=Paractinoplanes brasiliensis TaxID=52695 RepID=A0A4R6JYQ1_9ACTN|nr:DUF3099 domain-containing protein [Actinoplanes brasiliensis]TDO40851.1 hypothetical protein C8E87_4570 [Actinoplanes brasiliensis]GID25919.1 hypothetical protein Abr02nite_09020 [Actinoplanes brasiliensis]
MKKQPDRAVLITNAERSPDDQFRSRQIRYVTMMSIRAACVVIGAILVSARPPLLPLWLILCALGMVFLPWAAVLIANDRPARTKAERAASAAAREAKPQVTLPQHSAEATEYLTIDLEPTETGERWIPAEPRDRDRDRGQG